MSHSVVEESETKPLDIFACFPLWDLEYYKKPEIMVPKRLLTDRQIRLIFSALILDEHG